MPARGGIGLNEEKRFSLLREPWIAVMDKEGDLKEVSLKNLYRNAHNYVSLAGETEAQNMAVLRFLLAMLHAIYGRWNVYDDTGKPIKAFDQRKLWDLPAQKDLLSQWGFTWQQGKFPIDAIEGYMDLIKDHFYLFHPTHPFMQIPAVNNRGKGKNLYPPSELIGEILKSENKSRPFALRNARAETGQRLPYAEAARWLLYTNGFADSSNKPPRGAGLPSAGVGWLGQLSPLYAHGNNLLETLLLNLILLKDGNERWGAENPLWEQRQKEGVEVTERVEKPVPKNLSELYTFQNRHISLVDDGEYVVGYKLISGNFFSKNNAFAEQMTLWRYSNADKAYVPKTYRPEKQLWREFSLLVPFTLPESISKKGAPAPKHPGITKWLALLKDMNLIGNTFVTLRSTGVVYDSKKCSVEDISFDGLTLSAGLLGEAGKPWSDNILNVINKTDRMAVAAKQLQIDLAKSAGIGLKKTGGKQDKSRTDALAEKATEQIYRRYDEPFRDWLRSIDPEQTDYADKATHWLKRAKTITRKYGAELVEQAGPSAHAGREEDGKWHTSATAYTRFTWKLNAIFKEVLDE